MKPLLLLAFILATPSQSPEPPKADAVPDLNKLNASYLSAKAATVQAQQAEAKALADYQAGLKAALDAASAAGVSPPTPPAPPDQLQAALRDAFLKDKGTQDQLNNLAYFYGMMADSAKGPLVNPNIMSLKQMTDLTDPIRQKLVPDSQLENVRHVIDAEVVNSLGTSGAWTAETRDSARKVYEKAAASLKAIK